MMAVNKRDLYILTDPLSPCAAIFLGSFRMPYEEIRRMVVEVDEEQLTESMIQVRHHHPGDP